MKISTKGRYGLRSMLDIAINSCGEQVALTNIAARQNISANYLEQVFSTLKKAGLVKSIKGSQGGYILAESATSIKIGTILRALEGDLFITDESDHTSKNPIQTTINTVVWDKLNASINHIIDNISLEDLVTDYKKNSSNLMFYI